MTSRELAKLCDVSRATVDRVFNNRGPVSPATRERILEAARRAGYRPNHVARSLVTGRTRSIGLVVPNLRNAFFSTLLNAVACRARERGHMALLTLYEDRPEYECQCVMDLIERKVDGFILFSTAGTGETEELLRRQGVPTVLVLNEMGGFPCVSIDYRRAAADAVNYMLSKGCDRLVFLCPPLEYGKDRNIDAIRRRLAGFEDALERRGDIARYVIGTSDYLPRLDDLLSRPDGGKTAVLCSSDIYALKVMKHLKTRGLRIPGDVGVMGFDGIETLDYVEPTLATVEIPIARLGETAVEYLLGCIENGSSAIGTRIPYTIRPGQSIV